MDQTWRNQDLLVRMLLISSYEFSEVSNLFLGHRICQHIDFFFFKDMLFVCMSCGLHRKKVFFDFIWIFNLRIYVTILFIAMQESC